jgi:hypothetical protein
MRGGYAVLRPPPQAQSLTVRWLPLPLRRQPACAFARLHAAAALGPVGVSYDRCNLQVVHLNTYKNVHTCITTHPHHKHTLILPALRHLKV